MEGRFVRQSFQQYHKRTSPHHESLKNHCDSEQSVKFEKYGWKNAVLSAYLMRGVFRSTWCAESYTTCAKYFAPFWWNHLSIYRFLQDLWKGFFMLLFRNRGFASQHPHCWKLISRLFIIVEALVNTQKIITSFPKPLIKSALSVGTYERQSLHQYDGPNIAKQRACYLFLQTFMITTKKVLLSSVIWTLLKILNIIK